MMRGVLDTGGILLFTNMSRGYISCLENVEENVEF